MRRAFVRNALTIAENIQHLKLSFQHILYIPYIISAQLVHASYKIRRLHPLTSRPGIG